MDGGEEALADAVVEHGAYDLELRVGVAQPVAVGQIEDAAVELRGQRLAVDDDAALALQVVEGPDVVVAREVVHLDAHVCQLGDLAEEARVALRHHVFIFEPEVEHVAQQIDGSRLRLDGVEEAYESPLLHPLVLECPGSEVGVAQKVNIFHN